MYSAFGWTAEMIPEPTPRIIHRMAAPNAMERLTGAAPLMIETTDRWW